MAMELCNGGGFNEVFEAHDLVLNHTHSIAGPMSLKCAIELGIADIMESRGRPVSLSELARSIPIPAEKEPMLGRLMRFLVSRGVFRAQSDDEYAYSLTPFSRLLLRKGTDMSAYVLALLDPALVKPWYFMATWFKAEGSLQSPFEVAHKGPCFWDLVNERPELNNLFNEAMASTSYWATKAAVTECAQVFRGLDSLVDVGGGTGTAARIIAEAFPQLKCTVFDLPHVVASLPNSELLDAVAGDMFHHIPPANAVLLQRILHDWNDEECVKILKQCKKAIPSKEEGGKVIIVDIVLNPHTVNPTITETHLFFDLTMMIGFQAKEREEVEWKKIFVEAGFKDYKIFPLGLNSIIELYS